MADLMPRNLSQIRQLNPQLHQCLMDIVQSVNNVAQQTNAAADGTIPAPTPHSNISVVGGKGIFDVALTDTSPSYAGKENFVEYSTDPSFSQASTHVLHLGASRNWRGSLGSQNLHFRSYSQYPTSAPSDHLYHPTPVSGSGATEPAMQAGQGSGTSQQPGGGYGYSPYNRPNLPKR